MRKENLTYEDVLRIIELVKSSSQFSEFRLKVGEIEVSLRRRNGAAGPARAPEPERAVPFEAAQPHQRKGHIGGGELVSNEASAVPAPAHHAEPSDYPEGVVLIRSPMVGTVYRSPLPGEPPFVEVGQSVEADTTVCIIEVMKLMNSIPAGARGVVIQILVGDAEAVEYGQVLMVVEPR